MGYEEIHAIGIHYAIGWNGFLNGAVINPDRFQRLRQITETTFQSSTRHLQGSYQHSRWLLYSVHVVLAAARFCLAQGSDR